MSVVGTLVVYNVDLLVLLVDYHLRVLLQIDLFKLVGPVVEHKTEAVHLTE